jgi:hypothetical protein
MNQAFTNINEIPVKTWSWLKVNSATIKGNIPFISSYLKNPVEKLPEGIELQPVEQYDPHLNEGMPVSTVKKELLDFTKENRNSGYFIRIPENFKSEEPLILSYELNDSYPTLVDDTFILAEKDSCATVIIIYKASGNKPFFHNGITRVYAEKEADIKLIKIQMLKDNDIHSDHVLGHCEEKGNIEIILSELGGKEAVGSCSIDLLGEKSRGKLSTIYLGDKDRELDMNYRITHYGKNSESEIHSRGVLKDRTRKVFRGTIDFISGASGSKGSEEEHTILLSPNIKNISTPLLLCGEADVEGAHAASTGKLDENMLFYLMTRGLSEKDARKIMVEASFAPVIEKITLDSLKETLSSYVRGKLDYE